MNSDRRHMLRALELARRGSGRTSPNPMVGAVVVVDDEIIAEGWHESCGGPHAEARALDRAGDAARDATLYCTLEPCCHRTPDKRTPPCTEKIIEAGISRVVFAVYDPNPLVAGLGEQALKQAGIAVTYGVLRDEASLLNEPFFAWIQRSVPYVHLKIAATLDGRIASRDGSSRWISGEQSRIEVHRLRAEYDAVMVGAGTVISDDPSLTVRHVEGRNPARVVVDSGLRAVPGSRMASDGAAPVYVLCTREAEVHRGGELAGGNVELVTCPTDASGHIDLFDALQEIGRRGITSILVEGGRGLATALIRQRLVDRLSVYTSPSLMGAGIEWLGDLGVERAEDRPRLQCVSMRTVGADMLMTGLIDPARTYGSLRAPGEGRALEQIAGVLCLQD